MPGTDRDTSWTHPCDTPRGLCRQKLGGERNFTGCSHLLCGQEERQCLPWIFPVIGNAGMGCCLTTAQSQVEGGDEKEMARLTLWWRLFLSSSGPSQGFSLAVKNHVFHVFSLPGGGVTGRRQGDWEAVCPQHGPPLLLPLRSWGSRSRGSGQSRPTGR